MEIRVSMHKRFAQVSKEESWTSIFELRVQFGQTWRNKKRKKDRNFKLYRKNVHIYIYISIQCNWKYRNLCTGSCVFGTRLIRKLWYTIGRFRESYVRLCRYPLVLQLGNNWLIRVYILHHINGFTFCGQKPCIVWSMFLFNHLLNHLSCNTIFYLKFTIQTTIQYHQI